MLSFCVPSVFNFFLIYLSYFPFHSQFFKVFFYFHFFLHISILCFVSCHTHARTYGVTSHRSNHNFLCDLRRAETRRKRSLQAELKLCFRDSGVRGDTADVDRRRDQAGWEQKLLFSPEHRKQQEVESRDGHDHEPWGRGGSPPQLDKQTTGREEDGRKHISKVHG